MAYERKTIDINVSEDLREILREIESESIVASLLLKNRHVKESLVESNVDFISISSQDRGKISYLTSDRMSSVDPDNYWTSTRRYHAKPGAFISKMFSSIDPKEVEKFSGLFKSQSLKTNFVFQVVSGDDIKKYYSEDSYAEMRGSLGSSCMKHDHCQEYFELYSENQDKVSLLVMLDSIGSLLGRAILWNLGSIKIMDRIYTTNDENLQFNFKKWATENGFLYKSEQNWANTLYFEQLGQKKRELKIDIKLSNKTFYKYPYMDTFKFLDKEKGVLTNYIPEDNDSIRTLSGSEGNTNDINQLRLDDIDRVFRHRADIVYLDYIKLYTSCSNVQYSEINNQHILRKDVVYNETINDYVFNKEYDKYNSSRINELILERNERNKNTINSNNVTISDSLQGMFRAYHQLDSYDSAIGRISFDDLYLE